MVLTKDIKKLREITGRGFRECSQALKEAAGNFERALAILRSSGAEIVEKKASRATKAGVIDAYIHAGGKAGALIELQCETDFVARTKEFRELAHDIAMQVVAASPTDLDELLASPFIKDESETVKEHLEAAIAQLGENITIGRFARFEL